MAGDYRDYLTKNFPVMQTAQPPKPNPAQAQKIVADAFNRMLASRVIQPGTGPVQMPVRANMAGLNLQAGPPVSAMPMPSPRSVAPPIDYSGGGSGVTANDILGQLGPVVVDPKYRQPQAIPGIEEDFAYKRWISNGATPEQATALVLRERESAAQKAKDDASMASVQEPTGGLDPFGEFAISGGTKIADYAGKGLQKFEEGSQAVLDVTQGAQAEMVYKTAKYWRDQGMDDREIIELLKNPSNPLMMNIPVGPNDDDATITRFIDGLITAYDTGYTAYGYTTPVDGQPLAASSRVVVGQWGPGSKAAHEYIAGLGNIAERVTGDVALDPMNYALGPLRGSGESLAQAGSRLVAKGAAEEGAMAAAKVAAGRTAQVVGNTARIPDIVLNQVADNAVAAVANTAGAVGKVIPGVNRVIDKLGETPIRIKARAAGEDGLEGLTISDDIESGAGPSYQPSKAPTNPEQNNGYQNWQWGQWVPPTPTGKGVPSQGVTLAGRGTPYGGAATATQPPIVPAGSGPAFGGEATATPNPITKAANTPYGGEAYLQGDNPPTNPDMTVKGPAFGGEASVASPPDPITDAGKGAPYGGEAYVDGDAPPAPDNQVEFAGKTPGESGQAYVEGKIQPKPNVTIEPGDKKVRQVGDNGDVRINRKGTADGEKFYDVETKKDSKKPWSKANIETERFTGPNAKADAESYATGRVVTGPEATPASVDTNPIPAQEPVAPTSPAPNARRLPTDGMNRQQINAAIQDPNNKITQLTPIRGGGRLIDKAWELGDNALDAWNGFQREYGPKAKAYLAKSDAVERAYFSTLPQKALTQVLHGIEHTVDDLVPSYKKWFGDLGDLPKAIDRSVPEGGGKASFRNENPPYLMQRYVYTTDPLDAEAVMKVLVAKLDSGETWVADTLQRLKDARTRMDELRTYVDPSTSASPVSSNPRWEKTKSAILEDVADKKAQYERASAQSGTSPYKGPELSLTARIARDSNSLDEALQQLDEFGNKTYGPRSDSVRPSMKASDAGREVYENTRLGRGWKFVDGIKAAFRKFWEDAQKNYFVSPGVAKFMNLKPGEAVPPADVEIRDPSFELPPDVAAIVDYTPFDGAAEPLYKGKSLREVRNLLLSKAETDKARALQLVEYLKSGKAALGIPEDTELVKPGKAKKGPVNPPVISAEVSGPVRGRAKPLEPITSTGLIKQEQELVNIMATYQRYGDLLADDLKKISNEMASEAREFDVFPELSKRRPIALDLIDALFQRLPRHLLLADPLTSWGYTGRNVTGNVQTSLLGTNGDAIEGLVDSFAVALRDQKPSAVQINEDLGLGGVMPQYTKESVTAVDLVGKGAETPTRELAQKLHLDWVARRFDWKRGIDASLEYAAKLEMGYAPTMRGLVRENVEDLADTMATYASKRNIPITRDEFHGVLTGLQKKGTGAFSYDEAYDAMYKLAWKKGLTPNPGEDAVARSLAETASRKWKGDSRKAQLKAVEVTNRIFPSQRRMTNADQYARYITMFHFWPTRTARLVMEEMIRNPQLYLMWRRTHEGLERMAEEGDYPLGVRMFMRIAESPFGFMLYANPASFFLVTALQPERPSIQDPQGVTWLGEKLLDFRKKTGLGPTPFIDSALNMLGVYGNAFPPNPWPSRTLELAGSAIDYGLTSLGHGFGTPIYDNSMAWLRSIASGRIPGTTGVSYVDQHANTIDLVGSKVLDNNPELAARLGVVGPDGYPTPDAVEAQREFAEIMDDEDSDEYIKAAQEVAGQQLFTKMINGVSPITVTAKLESRERTLDVARMGRDSSSPTPYQEWAINTRGVLTNTPTSNKLDADKSQYAAIGTPRQKHFADTYNLIVNDEPLDGYDNGQIIEIGGQYFTRTQLLELDKDERFDLANAWVTQHGGDEELQQYRDERDAFVQKHPEFGDFKTYQSIAYSDDYIGGVHQFRIDRAKANPNFRREMESYREYLLNEKGVDPKLIEKELDEWATTIAAYKAANGIQDSVYDSPPISTGDQPTINTLVNMGMLNGSKNEGGGSYTGKKSTATTLTKQIKEYEADLKLVEGLLQQYGVDPSILTSNNPYAASSVQSLVGDLIPTEPKLLRQYREWVALQPPGVDTSPEAFAAVIDAIAQDEAA